MLLAAPKRRDKVCRVTANNAQMVELVDTLVSGTSVRKDVQVRVLFWVQKRKFC